MAFESLENNEATVNMIELTKYLLYCATNKSFGVKDLDVSLYSPSEFNKTGISSSQLLIEYIHYWENSGGAPTNADGTKYIVHDDGAGHPTVGYGVDIYNGGYTNLFTEAGYDLAIGAEIDVEFVDAIEEMELNDKIAGVEERVEGLGLTGYQKMH